MQQRALRCFSFLLYMGVAVGAVWLSVKFLLPWGAPFLLAFGLAALLERPVRALVRRGWRRRTASALLSLAALALVLFGLARLGARCLTALADFARQGPELVQRLAEGLGRLERGLLAYIDAAPPERSQLLRTALDGMGEALTSVPARLSQTALDAVSRAAQHVRAVLPSRACCAFWRRSSRRSRSGGSRDWGGICAAASAAFCARSSCSWP